MAISPHRREEILDALRRGTVPQHSLDTFAAEMVEQALRALRSYTVGDMHPAVEEKAMKGLKFSECLSPELARHIIETRLCDPSAIESILSGPNRFVVAA